MGVHRLSEKNEQPANFIALSIDPNVCSMKFRLISWKSCTLVIQMYSDPILSIRGQIVDVVGKEFSRNHPPCKWKISSIEHEANEQIFILPDS